MSGYESPSIIRYLEPLMGDLFTAKFADCHFDKSYFPTLGGGKDQPKKENDINWKIPMDFLDPRTNECKLEMHYVTQKELPNLICIM